LVSRPRGGGDFLHAVERVCLRPCCRVSALTGERIRRARKDGVLCGRREAKLFRLAVGTAAERAEAIDWLNNTVSKGRAELEARRAVELEVEAWDVNAHRKMTLHRRLSDPFKSLICIEPD